MRRMVARIAIGLAACAFLGGARAADAAEIKLLSGIGMRPILEELVPGFERVSGHKLVISFATVGAIEQRVLGGEVADVIIASRAEIERLAGAGKLVPGSVAEIAYSEHVLITRAGAPAPDISTPEAVKQTLLAARSLIYSDPAGGGVTGVYAAQLLTRLGIADAVRAKSILAASGSVVPGVAKGVAELGLTQSQEARAEPGVAIVGALPGDLRGRNIVWAAIAASARDSGAGKALVDFLRTPASVAVIKAKGMAAH